MESEYIRGRRYTSQLEQFDFEASCPDWATVRMNDWATADADIGESDRIPAGYKPNSLSPRLGDLRR